MRSWRLCSGGLMRMVIALPLLVQPCGPGYPDQTTEFPQYLYMDYVHVYQKDSPEVR
jgi:hypothetical protein